MATGDGNRLEYQHRVNRVIDYIQEHRAEELSLEVLAQVAAFSPFHFHRIFKAMTGENLKEFVQRVRLEAAASMLLNGPEREVLDIALDSGFGSASAFARAFKDRFGMTATEWRTGGAEAWSKERLAVRKPGQADRKAGDAGGDAGGQGGSHEDDASSMETNMNVIVKNLPTYRLAYMRNVGAYGAQSAVPQLWLKLMRWAQPRELWTSDRICLGIAHDDPRVTDPDKCRYDACIVIPAGIALDAQVNVVDFPGGKYAFAPFHGTAREIAGCWEQVFASWMPGSGFQPDDRPFVELYRGDAVDEKTFVVSCDLCTPVKPL
jgi:AraC family transcriptional regulator